MNERTHDQGRVARENENQPEFAARRTYIGLEWTESEWFEVWLELARESQKSGRN